MANPELQRRLFQDLVSFKSSFARQCGCSNSFLTTISNSFGFSDILSSLLKTGDVLLSTDAEERDLLLPGPLLSAHGIRNMLHPDFAEKDVGIATYLQGTGTVKLAVSTPSFEKQQAKRADDVPCIDGIAETQLGALAPLFVSYVEDELRKCRDELEILKSETYRDALRKAVKSTHPELELEKFFKRAASATLALVVQLDPGRSTEVQRKFEQAHKQAQENCKNIRLKAAMADIDMSNVEVLRVKRICKEVFEALDVAAVGKTLKSQLDVSNEILRAIFTSDSAELCHEEDEMPPVTHDGAEDNYEDLLESLSVSDEPEPSAESSDKFIDHLTLAIISSDALHPLLKGHRLSTVAKREIQQKALCSYLTGKSQEFAPGTPRARRELTAIFAHKSEDRSANFWVHRPSEWSELHKHLIGFLNGASYARAIDSNAYVALGNRLNPGLFDAFAAAITARDNVVFGLSATQAQAVMDNLATLVGYYKFVSSERENANAAHSLVRNVRVFEIVAVDSPL